MGNTDAEMEAMEDLYALGIGNSTDEDDDGLSTISEDKEEATTARPKEILMYCKVSIKAKFDLSQIFTPLSYYLRCSLERLFVL